MDQDPDSVHPRYLKNIRLSGDLVSDGILVYVDDDRNNKLVVLKPKLEGWILRAAHDSGLNLHDYGLPTRPSTLHREINGKLDNFSRLLDDLTHANLHEGNLTHDHSHYDNSAHDNFIQILWPTKIFMKIFLVIIIKIMKYINPLRPVRRGDKTLKLFRPCSWKRGANAAVDGGCAGVTLTGVSAGGTGAPVPS